MKKALALALAAFVGLTVTTGVSAKEEANPAPFVFEKTVKGNDSNTLDQTYATKLENKGETKTSKEVEGFDTVNVTLVKTDGKTWYFTVDQDAVLDFFVLKGGNGYAKMTMPEGEVLKVGVLYSVTTPVELKNGGGKNPAISHIVFYGMHKAPVKEETTSNIRVDFPDVSHIDVFYIEKGTNKLVWESQTDRKYFEDPYFYVAEGKKGYITGMVIKQSGYAMVWVEEIPAGLTKEDLKAFALANDTSLSNNCTIESVQEGLGPHQLTGNKGNGEKYIYDFSVVE